jgi:2-oxoglutarate ferredoxin oxidoreductase subunit alpha
VEARNRLEQAGVATSYLRLRALPLSESVKEFVAAHAKIYVIEMNTDAQMCQLVRLHVPEHAARILPLNHNDGLPLTARWITEHVMAAAGLTLEKENQI